MDVQSAERIRPVFDGVLLGIGAIGIGVSIGLAMWLHWYIQSDMHALWGKVGVVAFGFTGATLTATGFRLSGSSALWRKAALWLVLVLVVVSFSYYFSATRSGCHTCPMITGPPRTG